jgi:hypothetical protein
MADFYTQVANCQGIAKIRANPPFSVDIFRIKAYHWIVRMGKAKASSDGGGAKEAKAEMVKTEVLCTATHKLRPTCWSQ